MRLTTWIALAVMLAACGKSAGAAKREECEKTWARLVAAASKLAAAADKDLSEEMGAGALEAFVATCTATPDELIGCFEDPKSQPECARVRTR